MESERRVYSLRVGGRLVSLARPSVVGILNCSPDSFYSGSVVGHTEAALRLAHQHLEAGALGVDIGGCSSRPGAEAVSQEEEIRRVLPILRAIKAHFPDILLSIDTHRSAVAKQALDAGANMVNDIRGQAGEGDEGMLSLLKEYRVPYVMMHMRGTPATMQSNTDYDDVVAEVYDVLRSRLAVLTKEGIGDVWIDVGIGFAKTRQQNYALLSQLSYFKGLNVPMMIGLSRKSLIYKVLGVSAMEALVGTSILHVFAVLGGSNLLRVHDVKEAQQVLRLCEEVKAAHILRGEERGLMGR